MIALSGVGKMANIPAQYVLHCVYGGSRNVNGISPQGLWHNLFRDQQFRKLYYFFRKS